MQVPNDRLLDLRQPEADGVLPPEKRQRSGVVAEEQNPLAGFKGSKGLADLGHVLGAQLRPLRPFGRQRVRLENRQGDERRNYPN